MYCSTASGAQDVTLQEYFQIQVLVTYLPFSNRTHKTETRIAIGRKLWIATHLDQPNYLANQKQREINKYDLTVFIRLFQGSSKALKAVRIFRVIRVFQ